MDEANRLVLDLQARLKDLDRKVCLYRRDMASEFTKYADDLLRNVPKDISETVVKAINESLKECTALYPALSELSHPFDSPSEACRDANGLNTHATSSAVKGPPPAITIPSPAACDGDTEVPRSPHEREKEFRGLFTPSYLPLLDSTKANERKWSADAQSSSTTLDKGKEKEATAMGVDAATSTRSLASMAEPLKPPTPRRRNTDEVSIQSSHSDGPTRRSALRRSSSFSKVNTARRVRFEVAGQEVLPTASPVPDPVFVPEGGSSFAQFDDDVDDDEGALEQVEDINDVHAPPPRRISSTQALRALSREPLADDGTQWTLVSSSSEASPSIPPSKEDSRESSTENLQLDKEDPRSTKAQEAIATSFSDPFSTEGSPSAGDIAADEDDSSDEEVLAMKPRKLRKNKEVASSDSSKGVEVPKPASRSSPVATSPKTASKLTELRMQAPQKGENTLKIAEDDGLFQFEEYEGEESPSLEPLEEEREDDEDGSDSDVTIGEESSLKLSQYSRSPARSIPWPNSTSMSKSPMNSYKGHPFNEPIVDEQLHASLASLGAVPSFVGSVDGRSGLDESNMQSFRESLKFGSTGSFSGTPKSMTERMLMDELLEADEGKGE